MSDAVSNFNDVPQGAGGINDRVSAIAIIRVIKPG
jgi:hypothetical protein